LSRMLTDELEVIVRFVRVGNNRGLAETIAYRTNNQNAISLRDLLANDSAQIQIKSQFDSLYKHASTYTIKRSGEIVRGDISNEYAGQILLAIYNCRPWEAHQKYRVFDANYRDIFAFGISAPHIRLAQLIMQAAEASLPTISNERVRKYGLTKFILAYLVAEVLRQEPDGVQLLDHPRQYLEEASGANKDRQDAVVRQLADIGHDAAVEVNYYVNGRGDAYDYKSEFKSRMPVEQIREEVLAGYAKDKYRGRVTPFELPS
jgi:hypothetical protein